VPVFIRRFFKGIMLCCFLELIVSLLGRTKYDNPKCYYVESKAIDGIKCTKRINYMFPGLGPVLTDNAGYAKNYLKVTRWLVR